MGRLKYNRCIEIYRQIQISILNQSSLDVFFLRLIKKHTPGLDVIMKLRTA